MNQEEIKNILPHRASMLLLDSAYLEDKKAHGALKIKGTEWFLDGHFPGNPVVPGVIQCEILAQSACVLLADKMAEGATPYYTGLNNVRFKGNVRPGDLFETECEIIKSKGHFYWAKGSGYVDGRLCVSAEFSFAVMK